MGGCCGWAGRLSDEACCAVEPVRTLPLVSRATLCSAVRPSRESGPGGLTREVETPLPSPCVPRHPVLRCAPLEREWTWWAHTGGGNALAFPLCPAPPCAPLCAPRERVDLVGSHGRWKRPCLPLVSRATLCSAVRPSRESGPGGLTREVETPLPSKQPT
jgi:hypothetical protein